MRSKEIQLIDLFCGCGGASLGLQKLGIEPRIAVDSWETAARSYKSNFPKATVTNGLASKSLWEIAEMAPKNCWLHLSPPCQSYSLASNASKAKKSLAKSIVNRELLACLEIIKLVKPAIISLEEVAPFDKSEEAKLLLQELWEQRYAVRRTVIDFADYGCPSRRKRTIWVCAQKELFDKLPIVKRSLFGESVWEGLVPEPFPSLGWWSAIEPIAADLPDSKLAPYQQKLIRENHGRSFLEEISESYYVPGAGSRKNARAVAGKEPAPTQRALLKNRATRRATLIAFLGKEPVVRRPKEPSPTVVASLQKRPWKIFDPKIKEFTVDCAKLLMGFPLEFELAGYKYEQFGQVGNAVPPTAIANFLRPVVENIL